jgi:hypothetical protein
MSSTNDENKESKARNVSPDRRESTDKRQKRVATVSRCASRNQCQKRDIPVKIEAGRGEHSVKDWLVLLDFSRYEEQGCVPHWIQNMSHSLLGASNKQCDEWIWFLLLEL